jgi:Cu-processing system ATP-binding protein
MIQIDHLTKKFGRRTVLKDVTTRIQAGKITAIVGHNGSGKTTLMKCLLGLDRPTSGSIVIDGVELDGNWTYRERIGYMPQITRFPENLTAREIITMVKDLRSVDQQPERDLLELFQMADEVEKPVRTLSGGTRQKVSAVLALMFRPKLLLLDEPTAGLDPLSSRTLKDLLVEECRSGKTIVITSHIISELEGLANDLIYLLDGDIFYHGSVEDLILNSGEVNLERAVARLMAT